MSEIFSERVARLRIERDISSPEKLGLLTGVSGRTIRYWEKGVNFPRMDEAGRVADFFEVALDYLVCRWDEAPAPPGCFERWKVGYEERRRAEDAEAESLAALSREEPPRVAASARRKTLPLTGEDQSGKKSPAAPRSTKKRRARPA